ncbi:uncharacterized protein LOC125758322 [Rhipicephalus sanguineus]|uniref:uncharacterized protein LOC125758322 n=1 Tax=Rhipicephalus sanguineus TaxID=34632 RepID=UPI0020C2BD73|nr:uncharacterized protein LOC125758322 [Rhipicephalus sanguineus]
MPDLEGKVAIIIGASAGIGECAAKHFASLGCWLTLFARNADNLEKAAKGCCALGLPRDKVLVVPGDMAVEEDCENVVQKTVNHFGKIDILGNVAKAALGGPQVPRCWQAEVPEGELAAVAMVAVQLSAAIPHRRQKA